jgi:hypothetical protein
MKKTLLFNLLFIAVLGIGFNSCQTEKKKQKSIKPKEKVMEQVKYPNDSIRITKDFFIANYEGAEFNQDGDIAHQLSNRVADTLGKYLKASFTKGNYLALDFDNTKITTEGLDLKGSVKYCIQFPFLHTNKRDAFTGIEHCGSWDNESDYSLNKKLQERLINLRKMSIGSIKTRRFTTAEKFKEYWIQFKHKEYQHFGD